MARKIIQIDQEKCIGCGLCTKACTQNTIEIIDGKAKVMREDYCDGIGNCLPVCPVEAISFSNKDIINTTGAKKTCTSIAPKCHEATQGIVNTATNSALKQWPVQLQLIPAHASFFNDAHVLVAAHCTAFAYANFHAEFMQDKITIIACPKLDQADYTEKLASIFTENNIKSITAVRMDVPCCAGLAKACQLALKKSQKQIPFNIVTISTDGNILNNNPFG